MCCWVDQPTPFNIGDVFQFFGGICFFSFLGGAPSPTTGGDDHAIGRNLLELYNPCWRRKQFQELSVPSLSIFWSSELKDPSRSVFSINCLYFFCTMPSCFFQLSCLSNTPLKTNMGSSKKRKQLKGKIIWTKPPWLWVQHVKYISRLFHKPWIFRIPQLFLWNLQPLDPTFLGEKVLIYFVKD